MLKEKCLEAIFTTAAKPIYHLLKGSSAKAAADLLDQPPSLQHTATAEALALELRRQAEDNLVCALIGKDIGQPMSTKKDPNPSFAMKRQTTGHFHHRSSMDGQLHKGFHGGTVARLGVGPCPGLHVRSEISVGQFTQPYIHTEFLVRNGSSLDKIPGLIIPLAIILNKISVADVSVDHDIALSTLHAFEAMDLSGLGHYGQGSDELGENLQDVDLAKKPAMHIRDVSSEVRHIRVDFDWSEMHPTATQQIATAVRATFKEQSSSSLEICFLPEESFEHHNWHNILANPEAFAKPYAEYLTDMRSNYKDLTYKNIGAVIIPDSFSAWQPQDDHLGTYGIPADGTLKGQYLIHYMDPKIAAGVPDAGSSCTFFMDISWRDRQLPKADLTPQQIARITRDLTNRFHLAEPKFTNVGVSMRQEIEAATEQDDTDRAEYLQDSLEERCLRVFIETAAEPIYHLPKGTSARAAADLPNQPPSIQRAATAEALAMELRCRDREDDLDWYKRLSTWVYDNASIAASELRSDRGPEFSAVALPLPPGTQSRLGLYYLHTARQVNWPPGSYAFVTGGPDSGKTTTAMKLVAAIVSGGVGEIRQHQPKLTIAVESDPVTSDKPESTGWLDEHIIGAHSSDICDDTTLSSDYRVLPTTGGPNLECGLYALIKSMQHQMPDGAATPNSIDDLRSLVESPEYAQMVAISQGSGSSNMSVDELACVLKLRSERQGSISLQLTVIIDGNPLASVPIFASPTQDRFEQTYKEQVLVVYRPFPRQFPKPVDRSQRDLPSLRLETLYETSSHRC
ncbi:hypothetical protein FDENT_8969 [Fusarium denticulatum]|uniref:Uncharacterized protein n=1 Tax=Fusarium denticulatum TaxID=48507 RepID=A0A8H5X1U5_9HYPO|nr:hypothetical protein FDENT_8969 [Fusarium denticulatum]